MAPNDSPAPTFPGSASEKGLRPWTVGSSLSVPIKRFHRLHATALKGFVHSAFAVKVQIRASGVDNAGWLSVLNFDGYVCDFLFCILELGHRIFAMAKSLHEPVRYALQTIGGEDVKSN